MIFLSPVNLSLSTAFLKSGFTFSNNTYSIYTNFKNNIYNSKNEIKFDNSGISLLDIKYEPGFIKNLNLCGKYTKTNGKEDDTFEVYSEYTTDDMNIFSSVNVRNFAFKYIHKNMKEKYVLIKKILNKNNDIISNDTTVSCCDNILCTSSCSSLDEKCDEEEINKYDDFLKGTSRLSSLLKSPYFSSISSYRPCKGLSNNASFDLSSHKSSFDVSSHKSSFDLSSQKSSFDLSSQKSSFDLSSQKSSFDLSSQKSSFDLSSQKSSFDLSSHKSSFSSSSCPPSSTFSYASSVTLSSRKERKKWDIRTHGSLYKKWSCNKNDDKDMWIHRMNFHKHPNHIVKKKKHDYNKEHKSAYCKNGDDVNDEEYLKRMTKNIENYIRKMKDMIYYKRQIKKTKKRKEKKRKEKKIKEKKRKKKIKRSVNIKSICNDNNIKEYDNMNYNYINYKDHLNYENNNINDYNIHHYKKDIQKLYEHLNYEQNNLSTSLLENHYINKNETDHNLFWTCCSEENVEKPREMVFQKNCDLKKKSNEIFISHTQNTFPYNNNLSCICCARIYLIDKIIKVTSNKIKPLCICCFDILLNLIGINTIICISCFKCYFPFEFVNKCVICNSFDMINLKKEDKRNMNIVKKELHIFMELYKYKFSDHFNSDIFLNYFINMNYCFKYLYYYFTIHQQIVISNNFVLARYTFPFSQLLQIIQKDKHKNKMNMEKNMRNEFHDDKHEFDDEEKYKNEIQLKIVNTKENDHVINHMNSHLSDHVNNNIKDNINHNMCVNTQNELHDEYTNKVNEYYQIKNFEGKNKKHIGEQTFEELNSIQNKDAQEEYNIIQEIKEDIMMGERNNKKENYIMKNVETNKEKEQIIKEKEMKHIENDTIIKDDKVVEKEVNDKINVVNVKDIVDKINVVNVKDIVDEINVVNVKDIVDKINNLDNPNKNDKENNINLNTVHINNKKKEDKKEEICSEKRNKDILIVEKKNKDIFNKKKSINIRNKLYKNKDKGNSKDSVENFFYTFSKTIISHIEKLKNKKIKFSFNEFKNTHIKLNELNFNNTIRKYYANGDVLVVNIKSKVLEKIIPENYLFGNGLNVIKILDDNTIMTGSGDGYISLIDIEEKKVLRKTKLYGSINSIEMRNKSTLFISIYENIIYVMDLINNNHYVLLLIHNHYVNDLCFPFNYNYIMYTCSYNSVMAWQFYDKKAIYLKNIDKGKFIYYDKKFLNIPTEKRKKLCKLNLMHESKINNSLENKKKKNSLQNYEKINKNLICHSIKITNDGNYIALSIHNNIYLLTSKYMKIITVILNSHYDFCNVLIFYNKYDLITAGNNGDIKFWKFDKGKYLNVNTINYHSSIINQIILYADKYLCSCSEDGLITIYNIQESTLFKKIIDINNTRYKQISLNNQYDILLCCGNNNIFMYYDLIKYDISKNFYYSPFHNVLSLDIDKKGNYFITGSDDYKIRLYEFKSCTCLYIGVAHNNVIHKCLFTFDNMYIVSASKDENVLIKNNNPIKTENDVEHFKRRFRIHYGKEANEYDLNKNIYLKFKLLNKVQLLLEQKIKNFDNMPKNMEVYKIINEFGELIEEVSLQNNTYEKNNNILINYYLKNNIFRNDKSLLRQKKKRNISINKLNENYELLKENINSVLNILLFLYDTFNKNKNLNQLDLFHILKKIKMFLYDKEIKKLYNHFNDDQYNHNKNNKTTKSNEITKWKEKNVEKCDHILSRNDIRPEIICILNIRKKNMNNFLINNNNKVQIINKNCLQLFNEPYNFDLIYINNIYFKHFISNKIINKYIHNFVNKNNVVLFNFSINYLKNKKKISFFNSFHDYFMNVDKTKINTYIKHQLHKKNEEKKNFINNNEENHQHINEYKINSNQEKNIKYKKKTLFKKIINELNNKLNQKYSNEKYNLTLNIYAQKKKKIYNINKCLFRNETNLYYQKNDIHKKEHKVEIMLINNYDNNTNHKINEKIIQKEDMNKCKENEDSFQDRKNNLYDENNIDHTYYDEDKTNPFLPSYGMDIKNIKNINKYINFNNMNKFKKSSIIFLIQLELFLTSDENINIPKKKILHFTLVDINIPILYILKKKNNVNYFNEFKKKQNFDNIFINYIQSYFFNTNVNHYSHNIITHLFQKNPYICFLLYIHDDFIFTNNSEYNKLHQIHNVKKENYSRNMILQLLYIYYMCNICECFNFIKQHC
ncbi:hypothetical protein PFUGPA_03835 [Plasmodium falciparum Palo Alto/Uganda]|uniref:Uncharacterized protein n=1 Tax=Plasmodium falciparum (isolate Palo Alto / Uganda) TaxID=57270 RepID=W4IX66_PLAFP|nr:hypothetical protein PFUGPA_03835 [Plasmodium falciparum Palo Alto/Uganda]